MFSCRIIMSEDTTSPKEHVEQDPTKVEEAINSSEEAAPGAANLDQKSEEPKRSRFERRTTALSDVLRTIVRDAYLERFQGDPESLPEIDLNIHFKVGGRENWDVNFNPDLKEQLVVQLEDAEAGKGVYEAGRVFCFYCNNSLCDCAKPPDLRSVFHSYDSMGKPVWCDFPQLLVEVKHPEVDKIYEKGSQAISHILYGKQLKQDQLSSYGKSSKTYSLLGQIVFGYIGLKIPNPAGGKPSLEKAACTVQVAETRESSGGFSLKLNVIMGGLSGQEIKEHLSNRSLEWLKRAVGIAERDLKEIAIEAGIARKAQDSAQFNEQMKQVPMVLKSLAASINRGERQQKRRTQHVEQRRGNKNRPIHKAVEDVSKAAASDFYYDSEKKSMVCISQERAHIFNKDGQHITTFKLSGGELDKRKKAGRWGSVPAADAEALKHKITNFKKKPVINKKNFSGLSDLSIALDKATNAGDNEEA